MNVTGGVSSIYYFQRNLQGDVVAIYDINGTLKAKYLYDVWGNCTIASETTDYTVANANPIRYRGYYYDSDTGLYYCNARYYSPKWRRFISPDDTSYLDPENVNGLNLYCYCNNDPVNYCDPSGHMPEWLSNTLKVIGAVGIVIGVTALTVATAGVAAYLLGASAAMIGVVTTGAAIGGLVAGGLEIGMQIYENGIGGMNLGAVAIESFSGAVYGAITGVSSATTSAALRLGMRGARIALGGLSTALHGINNGDSVGKVLSNVGLSVAFGVLLQGALAGMDARTGKLSTSILQLCKLDGKLDFGTIEILLMIAILTGKSGWRKRDLLL